MAYVSKTLIAMNLKEKLHDYRSAHEAAVESSKLTRLAAGKAPIPGKISEPEDRERFIEKGEALRSKALSDLEEWRNKINAAKTAAPSDAAVRAVQIFQQRNPKAMTRDEYQAEAQQLADAYGDNYSAYQAIKDIAAQGGARITPHPLVADVENFDRVEHNIRAYFNPTIDVDGSGPSAGRESLTAMIIDEQLEE